MSKEKAQAVELLDKARRARHDLTARLLLAAAVQRVADTVDVHAVVTGGPAVDFYVAEAAGSSPAYPVKWRPSLDVDVLAVAVRGYEPAARLKDALADQLGFEPQVLGRDANGRVIRGRGVEVPDFRHPLEIVGEELGGPKGQERMFTVEVDGQDVHLRGPEDTLLAYADSGWALYDRRDWERALAIARTMREEMDFEYLRGRARERGMPGVLEEALATRPLPEEPRNLF